MRVVDNDLLASVREQQRCEWCHRHGPVDAAHVFARGMGGGSRLDIPENLVALCRRDHNEHHAGKSPTRRELLEVASRREGVSVEAITDLIYLLRRKPKP